MSQDGVFREYIDRILTSEGGYVNNPADPGGETKWGIAKRSYPKVDIANLTREQAIQIYHDDFWLRIGGDTLKPSILYQVLDASVNHGIGNGLRMLQRAVGALDDGHIGGVTLSLIAGTDPGDLILRFNAERIEFYTRLTTFTTFGRGWCNRVAVNLRFGAKDT